MIQRAQSEGGNTSTLQGLSVYIITLLGPSCWDNAVLHSANENKQMCACLILHFGGVDEMNKHRNLNPCQVSLLVLFYISGPRVARSS